MHINTSERSCLDSLLPIMQYGQARLRTWANDHDRWLLLITHVGGFVITFTTPRGGGVCFRCWIMVFCLGELSGGRDYFLCRWRSCQEQEETSPMFCGEDGHWIVVGPNLDRFLGLSPRSKSGTHCFSALLVCVRKHRLDWLAGFYLQPPSLPLPLQVLSLLWG